MYMIDSSQSARRTARIVLRGIRGAVLFPTPLLRQRSLVRLAESRQSRVVPGLLRRTRARKMQFLAPQRRALCLPRTQRLTIYYE